MLLFCAHENLRYLRGGLKTPFTFYIYGSVKYGILVANRIIDDEVFIIFHKKRRVCALWPEIIPARLSRSSLSRTLSSIMIINVDDK